MILFAFHLNAQEINELHFTGGAPFDTLQPTIIIPVLTETFRLMGIQFTSEYNPSARSLELSNSGKRDGELHRIYDFHDITDGTFSNLVRIDTPIMSVWLSFYTKIENITVESIEELKPYTVAYYRGRQNIQKMLDGVLPSNQINLVLTDEQAFRMLAAGRIDIVISESREGKSIINRDDSFAGIYELAKIDETKIYAYIHKKYHFLLPKINETLLLMKKNGSYQRIIDDAERKFNDK